VFVTNFDGHEDINGEVNGGARIRD